MIIFPCTFKPESSSPAKACSNMVFPAPGGPKSNVILKLNDELLKLYLSN